MGEMSSGWVGLLSAELHFPEAHSLKEKRMYVRSAKEQLRNRFGASVAEVDHHDTPPPVDGQRAARRLARPRAGTSHGEGAKAQNEDELPHGSDQVSVPGV